MKKKKRFIIPAAALLLLLAAAALIPYKTKVSVYTQEEWAEREDRPFVGAAPVERIVPGETAVHGDLYLLEADFLLGGDRTVCFRPRLAYSLDDVATAGSSNWTFSGEVVMVLWSSSDSVFRQRPAAVEEGVLRLTADENTVFTGGMAKRYTNETEVTLSDPQRAGVTLSVSTLDSNGATNAEAVCTAEWSGTLCLPLKVLSKKTDFTLLLEIPYTNNLK